MYININGFKLFIFEIKSDIHFKNEIIKVNNVRYLSTDWMLSDFSGLDSSVPHNCHYNQNG